jgi:4-amino-4-deoxy-L-arabinose transferase-like glycosyltransferase
VGSAFTLLPALGAGSLERAEIYFMDGARSMVERGDWLVPHYRGEPFFDKPALTYWLIAASFRTFGFTPAAARLVSVAAALAVVLATAWLGRRLMGGAAGLAGGFILATTFGFMTFGRWAMSDMLMTLWSTLAFALAERLLAGHPPVWIVPALGATLGLGFLTKGPVALLLPGLGILLLLWSRGWPRLSVAGVSLAAALFALLGLGWFGAVYARLGAGPLDHFFLRENVERFAGETYDSSRSPLFYLGTYLAEGAPWSLFMPLALWRVFRRRDEGSASSRLLLGWIALMLIPLSLSRGKIDYYILPAYPAASLVLGQFFADTPWGRLERGWARAVLVIAGLVLAAVPFVLGRIPPPWVGGPTTVAFDGLAAGVVIAVLAAAVSPSASRALRTLVAASAGVFLAAVTLLVPRFVAAQPNAGIVAAIERERAFRPDLSVTLCEDPTRVQRDILFYTRIPVLERCDLWFPMSSGRPFLLLLRRNERNSLRRLPEFRMVYAQDHLPSTVVNAERALSPPEPRPLFLAANYPSTDPEVLERARLLREQIDRAQEHLREAGQAPD